MPRRLPRCVFTLCESDVSYSPAQPDAERRTSSPPSVFRKTFPRHHDPLSSQTHTAHTAPHNFWFRAQNFPVVAHRVAPYRSAFFRTFIEVFSFLFFTRFRSDLPPTPGSPPDLLTPSHVSTSPHPLDTIVHSTTHQLRRCLLCTGCRGGFREG